MPFEALRRALGRAGLKNFRPSPEFVHTLSLVLATPSAAALTGGSSGAALLTFVEKLAGAKYEGRIRPGDIEREIALHNYLYLQAEQLCRPTNHGDIVSTAQELWADREFGAAARNILISRLLLAEEWICTGTCENDPTIADQLGHIGSAFATTFEQHLDDPGDNPNIPLVPHSFYLSAVGHLIYAIAQEQSPSSEKESFDEASLWPSVAPLVTRLQEHKRQTGSYRRLANPLGLWDLTCDQPCFNSELLRAFDMEAEALTLTL